MLVKSLDDVIALFLRFSQSSEHLAGVDEAFVRRTLAEWPKRNSIALTAAPDLLRLDAGASSYFGGRPTLPNDVTWPKAVAPDGSERSMVFLGQISCGEFAVHSCVEGLPREGFLFLFLAWDCEWGLLRPSCRVLHSTGDLDARPRALPEDVLAPRQFMHHSGQSKFDFKPQPGDDDLRCYPRRRINFIPFASLFRDHVTVVDTRDRAQKEFLSQWTEFATDFEIAQLAPWLGIAGWHIRAFGLADPASDPVPAIHQLLGFPCTSSTDQLGHLLARAGKGPAGVATADSWITLAQLRSDELMDWDWNGHLELRIPEASLLAGAFDDAVAHQIT
ncbi:protein of unknown function [Hyphomicrobium sp. 1Nfss2.1]|uniref:DUF1963 domain-containing protein n=1 Tax=Hyphomicrobium sp. 1Nfss2.1 TaxID=3413936 RepID=UPI003C7B5E2A